MAADIHFDKVSLLLHLDGANGSTAFTDVSASPKTVAGSGSAAISTAQSKFGGASLSLPGSGAFLSVDTSPDFDVATGDYTVEFWIRPTSIPAAAILINKAVGTGSGYPFQAYITTAGGIVFRSYNASSVELFTIATAGSLVSVNAWTHLAFRRYGNEFAVYVNGTVAGTASYSGSLPTNTAAVSIGAYSTGSSSLIGFIDEFRFTKGLARYTANFTPPTEAFGGAPSYTISGVVRDASGAFAARRVVAYREDTGALVDATTSNAGTGAYTIATTHGGAHTLVFYPASGESLPALVLRGVIPV